MFVFVNIFSIREIFNWYKALSGRFNKHWKGKRISHETIQAKSGSCYGSNRINAHIRILLQEIPQAGVSCKSAILMLEWGMGQEILEYSAKAAEHAGAAVTTWGAGKGEALALAGITYIGDYITRQKNAGRTLDWQDLFYLILANNILPFMRRFPAADVCIFLANAIHCLAAERESVFVADFLFLPVILPLVGFGHKVLLPFNNDDNDCEDTSLKRLLEILKPHLPPDAITRAEVPCSVLTLGSFASCASMPDIFLKSTTRAILAGPKDGLGNARFANARRALVEARLPGAILELPPPAASVSHMAMPGSFFAMWLDGGKKRDRIHFARVAEDRLGNGILRQNEALANMFGKEEHSLSMNIRMDKFIGNELCNLSFAAGQQLAQKSKFSNQSRLGDFAEILRCQLSREPVGMDELAQLLQSPSGVSFGGLQLDGSYLVREVNQLDLDPLTGILWPDKGRLARLFARGSGASTFFLRKYDIIFAFRGTENGIGATGFVQDPGLPALPSRYLYIIRAKPGISAIWLYYTLKSKAARNLIRSFASGVPQLFINVDALRRLPFVEAIPEEVARFEKMHGQLVTDLQSIEKIYARMNLALGQLGLQGTAAMRDLGSKSID